jgi:hypothetical protein
VVAQAQMIRAPMKLLLERHPTGLTCTIGHLSIDGEPFCDTLEDPIREKQGKPVNTWKVKGDTAIPQGTYTVEISWSGRFKCDLPILLNVPGFSGIRIHAGNTNKDTEGCILVGTWNGGEFIHNSRQALNGLMDMLEIANIAKRPITIEVRNP